MPLTSLHPNLRLLVSSAVPGISETTASLGLQDLAAQDEQLVRDMLADLTIPFRDTLYIKRLAPEVENNFAYSTCYWPSINIRYWFAHEPLRILFLGNRFLKELSAQEQLFVVTHEIVHFQKNHPRMNLAIVWTFNTFIPLIALLLGYITFKWFLSLNALTVLTIFCALQLSIGVYYGTLVQLGWLRDLLSAWLSRYNEHVADWHAIHMLNSSSGALAFLPRLRMQAPDVGLAWWQKWYCSHPSSLARIKKIAPIIFDSTHA